MMTENLKLVTTKDNVKIAIWKISDNDKHHKLPRSSVYKRQNIFLTHGTFSDKKTCLRIAEYLAALGHTCYILEWRGHGASPVSNNTVPKEVFNFETIATYDFEATFSYLFDELKLDNLHCVTHSGGGACLTMFLIQNPHYIDKINSSSMFACQVYGAIINPKNHLKILSAKLFTRLLGYIPAKKFNMGSINESYYMMNQWYQWNLHKNFNSSFITQDSINVAGIEQNAFNNSTSQHSSADSELFDYRQYMPTITIPIYAISAKGDKLISPTRGCYAFFSNFNNSSNVFCEYSFKNGDLDDYNHSRIMNSRYAAQEIWPTVAAWIEKHAD